MKLGYEAVRETVLDVLRYHNYSAVSIKAVEWNLKHFGGFLETRLKEAHLKDIGAADYRDVTEKDYYGYMDYCKGYCHGVKDDTLNGYGAGLKLIFDSIG